jgi:hypothetical protein
MSAADQKLTKVYSDRAYKYTTTVRHQGMVVAFAMDADRHIYYSVLNLGDATEEAGKTDADYWSQDPRELRFPAEITEVGYAAGGNTSLPVVQLGGRIEGNGADLLPEEIDPFLSSTARFTEDCPFSVYSDGTYVFVFRQAIAASHADAVFLLRDGNTSASPTRKDYQLDAGGAKIPVVTASLLCDRFLFAGGELRPTIEMRYRRSRHKTMPDSAKDNLGPQDMNGNFFFEPTQHISLVRNLVGGRFCVLQVPTQMPDVRYWQIFAFNGKTQRMDSFNIERSADGLFNTRGTQAYTSPDPQYQSSVYEREPGQCPFTGKELILVAEEEGIAGTGVLFDGVDNYVTIKDSPLLPFGGKPFAFEAWIRPDDIGGKETYIVTKAKKDLTGGFALCLDAQGKLAALNAKGEAIGGTIPLAAGQWAQVAASFDGVALQLFVNGEPCGTVASPAAGESPAPVWLGAAQDGKAAGKRFKGMMDEVRVWGRSRSADEIKRDRNTGLVGNETGLVAYYRCDEGSGFVLHDQTDNALAGVVKFPQGRLAWASSQARVGNHPGVRRDSFNITGRKLESAPSAVLYYQQEKMGDGAPLKRQARVLLTCATGGLGEDGAATENRHLAVVDFAVARDGSLAQIPDEVKLDFINTVNKSATLDEVSALEQEINKLKGEDAAESLDALSFDLMGQVNCGSKLQLNETDYTVEFWLKRQVINTNNFIFMLGGLFFYFKWERLTFAHPGHELFTPDTYSDQEWRHWACSYNMGTRQRIVYCNGVQVATDTAATNPSANGELILGLTPWGGANHCLDELRVWKRVRTPAEIRATLYNRVTGKEPGLEAYYTFPNGQLKDLSGHGYDGKITNGNPKPARSIIRSVLTEAASEQKRARINELQAKLANKTSGLRGGDVAVPVPLLATDSAGLSIMGGLLGFAYSNHRPVLLDSASGNVVLYFRGQNGNFYSSYYDTLVSRHFKHQPTATGAVTLIARSAGLDLTQTSFTVAEGASPAFCTVQIASPGITETWPDVPRDPRFFADVLNGFGDEAITAGKLSAVEKNTLVLAVGLSRPLAKGAEIRLGSSWSGRLSGAVAEGAVKLSVVVAPASELAAKQPTVYIVPYDYAQAKSTKIGSDLTDGSVFFAVDAVNAHGAVQNGTAYDGASAATTRFWTDAPGRAFSFDGRKQYLRLPTEKLSQVEISGAATLEAWVNANTVAQPVRLLHANTGNSCYTLGLKASPAKDALAFDHAGQVCCGSKLQLNDTDFTVEFWLKRQAVNTSNFIIMLGGLFFYFKGDNFTFTHPGHELLTPNTYSDQDWHHWACSYDKTTRQRIIYRDGVQVTTDTAIPNPGANGELVLGATQWGGANYCLDELRIWKRLRTPDEIKADLYRRIKPDSSGLEAYYTFPGGQLKDLTGRYGEGKITSGKPVVTESPFGPPSHQIFAGIGPNVVCSRESFPNDAWNHIAVGFNQSWALDFNGSNAWLNAGTDESLNLVNEFTIEALLQVNSLGRVHGILGKGRLADGSGQSSPYQLAIAPDGKIVLNFETRGGGVASFSSSQSIGAGVFQRIAVVRQNRHMVDSGKFLSWQEIAFFIDGKEVGRYRYEGESPAGHNGPLELGRIGTGGNMTYFGGVISEVRLWGNAQEAKNIGVNITGGEKGLVARWTFDENRGNAATDLVGGIKARLYGARWTKDPDPRGSFMRIYVNGSTVAVEPVSATDRIMASSSAEAQFTLGGMIKNGALQDAFAGTIEELRIWRTRRTDAEILDNLFCRLRGDIQDLLAYYTFDFDSTDLNSTQLVDNGLRGNHLPLPKDASRPDIILSNAPVSNDTAQVRSALAGVKTAFHESIDAEPAVCEYGTMQTDSRGTTTGAMKRCYSFIQTGHGTSPPATRSAL